MKRKRNVYLNMKSLDEARRLFLGRFDLSAALDAETVAVADAVGRVLAEPVYATISSPSYHGAAMDGIAVAAEQTYGASELAPRTLQVGEQAVFVNTGDVLPPGTDAVVMIENVREQGDGAVQIEGAAPPWQHVRKVGEDIVATEMLFARNHRVTPYCLGALLNGGVLEVSVKRRPRVRILPSGSEIVAPTSEAVAELRPGQIIESNGAVLTALVERCGGEATRGPVLPDDPTQIAEVLSAAAKEFDLVLLIGGSSAGAGDCTRLAIESVGEVLVHGVTIMPGKPTVLGAVGDTPVVGMPGYPVSTIVAFEQLVAPLLGAMLGASPVEPPKVEVVPARKVPSKLGLEEFVRVRLGRVGERISATPLPRGAGAVTSITQADGIIRIGADLEGLRPGEPVEAELLRPLAEIEQNLVVVGSHDNTLDVLADLLRKQHGGLTLASSHVGSLGGIMAIQRGACHVAGSHLLDPEDGSYNVSYLHKHLSNVPVKLVRLCVRQQGLILQPGNPKGIQSLSDLVRSDVRFINRQGGSGTRVLLDYHLEELGLDRDAIRGYETEEFTHMAVAVAVFSDAADVGLGIQAAAGALGLDFVPVVEEQYDLIIPTEHFGSDPIQKLLQTIRSDEFRERVEALGGYRLERTGEVLYG
jgi:putative molybdopterin biosynthesis protein